MHLQNQNKVDFDYYCPYRFHYCGVVMGVMASQITSLTYAYSAVYSGADQRKHQSSASLACVRGIHRWPVNTPHKEPVTRKMFPFDDVIIFTHLLLIVILVTGIISMITHPPPNVYCHYHNRSHLHNHHHHCHYDHHDRHYWQEQYLTTVGAVVRYCKSL